MKGEKYIIKLNLDCVRQLLLCVEDNTGLRRYCYFIDSGLEKSQMLAGEPPIPLPDHQSELLKNSDNDELIYHINYCVNAELLSTTAPLGPYRIVIAGLTPKGHDFLENIRDNKVWSGVKNISTEVGARSLGSVRQIASTVMVQLIKKHFGL